MTDTDTSRTANTTSLGLVADPDAPQRVAERVAEALQDRSEAEGSWKVDVEVDPVTAGRANVDEILQATGERRQERSWDYAICVTDLPVRRAHHPILAEVNLAEQAAVISLPTLGGLQPFRRTEQLVRQVFDDLIAAEQRSFDATEDQHGLDSALTTLLAPIHRQVQTSEHGEVYVRYYATRWRGRARLLSGMVRANRPWRLVFGLSRALAAAVAASAFGLSSSTIWQIGDQLGIARQLAAVVAAIVVLVGWLIAAHQLWETRSRTTAGDREQVWLYNLSTVASLLIGVSCLYATLFVINFALAAFLVPASLLSTMLGHPPTFSSFVGLAWAFTTIGAIAGALGSSLETDHAVRRAAYGYREQRRRADKKSNER